MWFSRWFKRVQIRMDHRTLVRRGEWGNKPVTLLWCLDQIKTFPVASIDRRALKDVDVFTPASSIDLLIQAASVYNIAMAQRETLPDLLFTTEGTARYRTLDEFFVDVHGASLPLEEVCRVIDHQLRAWIDTYCLLFSNEHPNFEYYERRSQWLFNDFREVLTQILVALDPELLYLRSP